MFLSILLLINVFQTCRRNTIKYLSVNALWSIFIVHAMVYFILFILLAHGVTGRSASVAQQEHDDDDHDDNGYSDTEADDEEHLCQSDVGLGGVGPGLGVIG